ncbi:hypothetical protein L6452_10833 [Arctium lappa]|uniref:Uncharacterized protein n=2 Tax=Arctium lappa TaxID=4217 RepID=A0ACB9DN97_ARCLA|nr:hypothetical protein L6452_10832 [Arctium lappa]KAI3748021.1 hypothetical protein L6452_10833 [Arctium lappa]
MEKGKTSRRLYPRDVSRRRWTPLEDAKLCEQVAIQGWPLPKWKAIAKEFPGRSRNSCKYRWEKLLKNQETSGPAFYPPRQWVCPPFSYDSTERSREEVSKENEGERSLWIPKTLRIDDPDHEATKILIWATLGIENKRYVAGHVNGGGGIFKAFQSKKKLLEEPTPALQSQSCIIIKAFPFESSSVLFIGKEEENPLTVEVDGLLVRHRERRKAYEG